ncbi:MAG: ATP-binding cassette domain-containing protein [Promethearchaeota archaeon]
MSENSPPSVPSHLNPSIKGAPVIEFHDFFFRYGNTGEFALKNIDLTIQSGEVILLGGISGSGKSTLCSAITGAIPFNIKGQMKGSVELLGKTVFDYTAEELATLIAYVFQNADEQLVTFSVRDEIAFALENMCLSKNSILTKIQDISQSLGIQHLLDRSIYSLSGGEKQKVVLAASLVMNPEILILDEPLAFLDQTGENNLLKWLSVIRSANPRLTIIIVEHRLRLFVDFIDRICLLNKWGELEFDAPPSQYFQSRGDFQEIFLRDHLFHTQLVSLLSSSRIESSIEGEKIPLNPLIQVNDLDFSYPGNPNPVFSELSLSINSNEILGVVGDNGSGKTTLLYLLARILEPNQGDILFQGKNLRSFPQDSFFPQIGFIFQNPENQIFANTVHDEILYGPRNFGVVPLDSHIAFENSLVEKYLPLIGEYRESDEIIAQTNPFQLSWGQKRRLNLASIFAYDPDILLIDEPFIGQDAASILKVLEILDKFHAIGKTIVIVSHDHKLLETFCTRVIDLTQLSRETKLIDTGIESLNGSPNNENQIQPLTDSTVSAVSAISVAVKSEPATTRRDLRMQKLVSRQKRKRQKKMSRIDLYLNQLTFQNHQSMHEHWLYTLNPMLKILILITFTAFLFFQSSIIILFGCYIIILIVAKLASLSWKRLLRQMRWFFALTLVYIPLNTLFDAQLHPDDTVLFYLFIPQLPVRRIALYFSLRTGFLIIILLTSAILFTQTTSLKDLVHSMIQWGVPYRFAFTLMIGLRYLPLIEQEANLVEIAQKLRGAGLGRKNNLKSLYRYITQRITTLMINLIRKAKITSLTIESRGFGISTHRSNLYHVDWSSKEWVIGFIYFCLWGVLFGFSLGWIPLPISIPSLYSLFSRLF